MKLPNAESAIVSEQKITCYLLNPAHPAGGSKALFSCLTVFPQPNGNAWPGHCFAMPAKMR